MEASKCSIVSQLEVIFSSPIDVLYLKLSANLRLA